MHRSINIPSDPWSLEPFANQQALRDFYSACGCDGLELILCGTEFEQKIAPDMVRGLHLIFYPEWIRLWREEYIQLDQEFGSRECWQGFYQAKTPEDLLNIYKKELDVAQALGAEYVVFHMGDNPLDEYHTYKRALSDEEIVDASCELLNQLFSHGNYSFYLLLENLWPGGMNLTRPEITWRALEGVEYAKTGLMLDTGHLAITNRSLRTQAELCAYVEQVLDSHGGIEPYIQGIHLHQSLSGEYLQKVLDGPSPVLTGDYYEKYGQVAEHLRRVDTHEPFSAKEIGPVVSRINPQFLVHELSRKDLQDWEKKLAIQNKALGF